MRGVFMVVFRWEAANIMPETGWLAALVMMVNFFVYKINCVF
jgi:hypothetical protein